MDDIKNEETAETVESTESNKKETIKNSISSFFKSIFSKIKRDNGKIPNEIAPAIKIYFTISHL